MRIPFNVLLLGQIINNTLSTFSTTSGCYHIVELLLLHPEKSLTVWASHTKAPQQDITETEGTNRNDERAQS